MKSDTDTPDFDSHHSVLHSDTVGKNVTMKRTQREKCNGLLGSPSNTTVQPSQQLIFSSCLFEPQTDHMT